MIGHILQAAADSKLFETIHVSTESSRIVDVVETLGFPVDFPRPDHLADDHTPLMPVLRYVVETYAGQGRTFDEIWLLMACAPLIEADDLVEASSLFSSRGGERSVVAVAQFPVPVEWAFHRRGDGGLDPVNAAMMAVRSQDIEPAFYDAGAFYAYPARAVLESSGAGDYSAYVGHLLPRLKAVDIDSEEDLQLAEFLFNSNAKNRRT